MRVELSAGFFAVAVIAAIFTVGVGLVALWLIARSYPARLEADAVVTRGGARHAWKDLAHTSRLQKGALRLEFPGGSVLVVPRFLAAPGPVLAYLQRCGVPTGVYETRTNAGAQR
jgi:hypothetical protein